MIDINIIKSNGKHYSVKCNLIFDKSEGKTIVTAKILNVDLINLVSATSYVKLKNVFHSDGFEILSRLKYQHIYDGITKKLIQKFKMDVLNI